MSQKLLDVEEEVITGAHPSLPNDRIPFWEKTSNVITHELGVVPAPGHFLLYDKAENAPKLGLIEAEIVDVATRKKTLFAGTQDKLFRWLNGTATEADVSRAVGGPYGVGASLDQTPTNLALRWSFAQWGEWVLASNGHDRLQLYRGTDAAPQKFFDLQQTGAVALPFSRAEIIRRIKVHAVALNTSNGQDLLEWCNTDDLFSWTPTAENTAGALPVRNLNSQIMAAEDLGQAGLAIYGRDQLHLAEYIGSPNIIGVRKLLDGVGAFGKSAVVALGSVHYGWGPRGIWLTDGGSVNYVDNPSIRDYIKANLNQAQTSKIVAWPLINFGGVVFFFPTLDQQWNIAGLFLSLENQTWWPLEFGRQAGTAGTVFDFPITADDKGNVYQVSDSSPPATELFGPLTMVAVQNMSGGFGFGGFGDLGFGGWAEGVG